MYIKEHDQHTHIHAFFGAEMNSYSVNLGQFLNRTIGLEHLVGIKF